MLDARKKVLDRMIAPSAGEVADKEFDSVSSFRRGSLSLGGDAEIGGGATPSHDRARGKSGIRKERSSDTCAARGLESISAEGVCSCRWVCLSVPPDEGELGATREAILARAPYAAGV